MKNPPAPTLLTTGITPLPDAVRRAMARRMIDGHGAESMAIIRSILRRVQDLMGAQKAKIFLLPTTGTGALEASLVNHLSPNDEILVCTNGFFSRLYAEIARAYGLRVTELTFPYGEGVDWQKVLDFIVRHGKRLRAILITHHETSTGALTNLADMRELRNHTDALFLVNALSSLGGTPLAFDEWGIDVVASASHKGLMCPPGVGFVTVSPRAERTWHTTTTPRAFWDLRRLAYWAEKDVVPFDPPLPILYALDQSLSLFADAEARAGRYARTLHNATVFRDGLSTTGIELVAPPNYRAPNASVLRLPQDYSAASVRAGLRDRFAIYVSPGMGELADRTIRVNHQGHVSENQMNAAAQALQAIL